MASTLNLIPAGIIPFFGAKFLLKTKESQELYLRVCCKQRRSWNIRNLFIVWLDNPIGTPKSVARAQRGDLHSTKQLLKHTERHWFERAPKEIRTGHFVISGRNFNSSSAAQSLCEAVFLRITSAGFTHLCLAGHTLWEKLFLRQALHKVSLPCEFYRIWVHTAQYLKMKESSRVLILCLPLLNWRSLWELCIFEDSILL